MSSEFPNQPTGVSDASCSRLFTRQFAGTRTSPPQQMRANMPDCGRIISQDIRSTSGGTRMRKVRNVLMSLPLILAFSMYMFAQGGGGGGAGGGGVAGNGGGTGHAAGAPGAGSSVGTSTSEAPPAQGAVRADTHGNKTLKGCVQSSGSEYMLQEDNGKTALLAGESVSSYVGQEVSLRGSFETGQAPPVQSASGTSGSNNSSATAGSSNSTTPGNTVATAGEGGKAKATDHPGQSFVIHHVDKVSDQCKSGGK